MSGILTGLDLPTIATWITTVAIPAVVAVVIGFKNGGLKGALKAAAAEFVNYDKLMTQSEPMTPEQETLLTSGKVSDAAWKMSDETFNQMYETLETRYDILINRQTLYDTVKRAEAEHRVDYGLIITNKDGTPNLEAATHVYVEYGVPMYCSYETAKHNAEAGGSVCYNVMVWWHLTEIRKHLLLSEIQMSSAEAACVEPAMEKINREEARQTETYFIECKVHYWKVHRGKVVERGASGDKKEPVTE